MEKLELNKLLNRINEEDRLKEYLNKFELNKNDLTAKNNIYLYCWSGT